MDIPQDNPMTVEGVALGKRLFHDPILSANNTLACIDCHKQKEIDMENNDYYTEMHEKIKSNPKYKNKKITPALIGGMECGKCHY